MKKAFEITGIGIIILALFLSFIFSSVRISSSDQSIPTDIFGLSVPQPPEWTGYIPFIGELLNIFFESFSVHGLVVLVIILPLIAFGFWLISLSSKKNEVTVKKSIESKKLISDISTKSPAAFKEDLGVYLKSYISNNNSLIELVEPFIILNLILYPNNESSITIEMNNRIASLDFNIDVLKIFVWVLRDFKQMSRSEISRQIHAQTDQPIIIRFNSNKPFITGMVLFCKLKDEDISETTGEKFIPLSIEKAVIIKEPVLTIIE